MRHHSKAFATDGDPSGDEKETAMSFIKENGFLAAAFLLSIGVAGIGFGQQGPESEGIVRITDGRMRTAARQGVGQQVTPVSAFGHHGPVYSNGADLGNCPTGDCPTGNCPTGNCPQGRGCKFGEHYCKHSPDYGYSPPAKYPLHRRGVEYDRYYPSQWYGAGADYSQSQAPMVYQATDTTQLGFYYQHVPYWRPMPERLPPRPIPSQWHITPPPVEASGFCRNGYGNYGNYGGYSGHGVHGWNSGVRGNRVFGWGQSSEYPVEYGGTPSTGYPTPQNGTGTTAPTPVTPPPAQTAPVPIETQSPGDVPPSAQYYDNDGGAPNPLPTAQAPSATPITQTR